MMRSAVVAVVLFLSACGSDVAGAHELRTAFLELRQIEPDVYDVLWKVPAKGELRLGLYVRFPDDSSEVATRAGYTVDNAFIERWKVKRPGGLEGEKIAIDGLAASLTDVIVRLEALDGSTQTYRLNAARTSLVVQEKPSWRQLASAYTMLGIEHILMGVDHLLFVLGLLMIVRSNRTLVETITAFTVAHSITLGLAVFGVVNASSSAVDAAIALSIVVLGIEILNDRRDRPGLTNRYPWMVAFAFGLLHGLGFAGALTDLGLPASDIPVALLFFNVGVELGQLGFVALILVFMHSLHVLEFHFASWVDRIPAYLIGTLGAFWTTQRALMLFSGG